MSASSSHTTGANRQEAGSMGVDPWDAPLCHTAGTVHLPSRSGTWSVRKGENKTGEKHGPPCLARVQSPRCPDVLQIEVVSPDEKRLSSPLKPMSPRLQGLDDSQQLPVPHIVSLRRAKLLREEDTGAELRWCTRALRENRSYPSLGRVHLHYERQRGIRMGQLFELRHFN